MWITAHAPASTVAVLMRTTWRSVTAIVERVVAELAGRTDLLDGLRRIGIDEIAHRKGQRYITCVIDHDTGRLVWAKEGRDMATLAVFFDRSERPLKLVKQVSGDGRTGSRRREIMRQPRQDLSRSLSPDAVGEQGARRGPPGDVAGAPGTPAAEALKGSRRVHLARQPDRPTTKGPSSASR